MTASTPATRTCDVVVLGGGPTGLCTALELNRHGIDTVLVERRTRDSVVYPTANHITTRSMELFRLWGLADRIRNGGFPTDHPDGRYFLTSLGSEPFHVVEMEPNGASPDPADRCTEASVWCPRPFLDPILIRAIEAAPHVQLLDGWEIDDVVDDDGIQVSLTAGDGEQQLIQASWAVVAEGSSSRTRAGLGIDMVGLRIDHPTVDSLLFDAPGLAERLPGRGTQFWFLSPHDATIVSIDGADRYRAHVPMARLAGATIDEYLTDVLGPITRVAQFPWSPGLALADRYRQGRVFLAGDAAHVVTPYGGLGMNTGIEDAANIGSKLGAVVAGRCAETLLDDYELERRPVAEELLRYQGLHLDGDGGFTLDDPLPLTLPALPDDLETADAATRAEVSRILHEQRHLEFTKPGLELGIEYPVDGVPAARRGPEEWSRYDAHVAAGRRAPHAVGFDGTAVIDAVSDHPVVVVGTEPAVTRLARKCADAAVDVHTMPTADERYQGWTVVRSDGFVVSHSRADDVTDDEFATLLTRLHARTT